MSLASKLMHAYFNFVYNPVYDFSTGRLNRYRELQERCISKLELEDDDRVLCVGTGTGNEILHILRANRNVSIVGVDYSAVALRRAYSKARKLGKEIEVLLMNAGCLEFATARFDKVICLHVMDFIEDNMGATSEIFRVLKDGGQFVITYPSGREGPKLAANLLGDNIRHAFNSKNHRMLALAQSLAQILAGIVYLPLVFRPKQKYNSRGELEAMITQFTVDDFQIEEDPIYQDFIVYGEK